MLCCLIIHHVDFYFEPFGFEHFEVFLVGFEYYEIGHPVDWCGEDTVGFVVVHDEVAHTPVDGDEGEISSHVVINDAVVLVGKCAKTKHVCDRGITVVGNNIMSLVIG